MDGQTGVPLDSTLSKLLFALRFRDFDLLITDQVQAGSQLLFHRTLSERLGMIAPFLRLDKDPYLVVVDGKLVYVQDAYTVSDRFPNASLVRHRRARSARRASAARTSTTSATA